MNKQTGQRRYLECARLQQIGINMFASEHIELYVSLGDAIVTRKKN